VRDLKDQIRPIVAEGVQLYRAGRLEEALPKFQEAQSILPQDVVLNLLMRSLKKALDQGQRVKGVALLELG
jgi:hypothetical protein